MTEKAKEFLNIRRSAVKKDFGRMNDMQFSAVTSLKGPLLILAGAGSGKTTVLVNRIANLVKYGDAYNSEEPKDVSDEMLETARREFEKGNLDSNLFKVNPVRPYEILAITFTNKAAGELKERISAVLGETSDIWAGTFHSICAKILRFYGERLGYSSRYTIYDTDDQKRVMKDVYKSLEIDEKMLPIRSTLNEISRAKDRLISPQEFKNSVGSDVRLQQISKAYIAYENSLKQSDAMDFDDLIINVVRLFESNPDVLQYYSDKLKYIMVDEYQDTNYAQYMFVKMLADKHRNICVVGDDDQSIYRFRGATIENILNFEDEYKDATVIRLEQNYRSTQNILDAANNVISNNMGRKGKNLWTDNGEGEKITVYTAEDEREEGRYVADSILEGVRSGKRFSDHAVLYRMNAQSNAIENVLARSGIPYRVIGGTKFYERKEIKDVLSYLHVINNTSDSVRLRRIINEPKRGIGETTLSKAISIASSQGMPLFEVFKTADEYADLSRASQKLKDFSAMIEELIEARESVSLHELVEITLSKSGYMQSLLALPENEQDRLENVKEFSSSILQYEEENQNADLNGFLEEISLVSDIDSYDNESDTVVLMTMHSAKGLEFDTVFIVGAEEGIFPGTQTIFGGREELEEERRLAYVGITRAKKSLYITNAYRRMLYGQTTRNRPSRFIEEIPADLCNATAKVMSGAFSVGITSGYSSARSNSFDIDSRRNSSAGLGSRNISSVTNPKPKVDYSVGQRVLHKTFGNGSILKVTPMGNDALLEINFESVGIKKLMAGFANLEKLS